MLYVTVEHFCLNHDMHDMGRENNRHADVSCACTLKVTCSIKLISRLNVRRIKFCHAIEQTKLLLFPSIPIMLPAE